MKRYPLIFLIWIFPVTIFGQRYISGRIIDAENNEPIPGVSVFIANTTVGAATGADGFYRLKLPGEGSYRLTVSHIGYQSVFSDIEPGKDSFETDIALKVNAIEEVTVAANVQFRKRDIDLFWKTVLGKPPSKKTIYALNPEKVYYYYNSKTGILKVTCREPLQIINNETGYHIQLIINYFTHDYTTNTHTWEWERTFRELEPVNQIQKSIWEENRKKIYQNSLTNFIKSLYHNILSENGFLLTYPKEIVKLDNYKDFSQNLNPPLIINSTVDFKTFHIPSDSELMLICFGKTINQIDIRHVNLAHEGRLDWLSIGLFRNMLKTPQDPVQIFPDGTFKNPIQMTPCFFSVTLFGLDMALPADYSPY